MHRTWSHRVKLGGSVTGCVSDFADEDKKACAAAIIGSLTASLHDRRLLPHQSILYEDFILDKLVQTAKDIAGEVVVFPDRGGQSWGVGHSQCGPSKGMLQDIKEATAGLYPVPCDAHYMRLEERAENIGADY